MMFVSRYVNNNILYSFETDGDSVRSLYVEKLDSGEVTVDLNPLESDIQIHAYENSNGYNLNIWNSQLQWNQGYSINNVTIGEFWDIVGLLLKMSSSELNAFLSQCRVSSYRKYSIVLCPIDLFTRLFQHFALDAESGNCLVETVDGQFSKFKTYVNTWRWLGYEHFAVLNMKNHHFVASVDIFKLDDGSALVMYYGTDDADFTKAYAHWSSYIEAVNMHKNRSYRFNDTPIYTHENFVMSADMVARLDKVRKF